MQSKKTVLITGATDGIGRALAKIYRTRGDRLVLVGRRTLDTLNDALYTKDTYCRTDLSHDGCADRVREFLNAQKIDAIDLAIQNAGTGYFGTYRRTKRGKHSGDRSSQPDGTLALDTRPDATPEKNQWKTRTHRLNHTCLPLSRLRRVRSQQRSPQHPGTQFANRGRRKCTDHSPGSDAHGLASKNWPEQRKDKGISVRRKGRPKNHTGDRWTAFYRDNWMEKCMGAIFGTLLRRHSQRHSASNVKHAVITGAAHGIGKALAPSLCTGGIYHNGRGYRCRGRGDSRAGIGCAICHCRPALRSRHRPCPPQIAPEKTD